VRIGAKAVGLVSDVVADDQLLETGLAFAAEMARASPMGLRPDQANAERADRCPGIDAALMDRGPSAGDAARNPATIRKPSRHFGAPRPDLQGSIELSSRKFRFTLLPEGFYALLGVAVREMAASVCASSPTDFRSNGWASAGQALDPAIGFGGT